MLASTCDNIAELKYPVYATPKIDGIRCLIVKGVAMSRSLKPIPNKHIQKVLGQKAFNGFDGELVVKGTFQDVSSAVMSEDGKPDFTYCVFDIVDEDSDYLERMESLKNWVMHNVPPVLTFLLPTRILDKNQLQGCLDTYLKAGHEGAMVRSGDGPYKYGRSTIKEGYLLKVKPFDDAEAVIVDFEEQMHNGNQAKRSEVGRMKRSSHKANKSGKDTLGALVCRNYVLWPDQEFNIGSGMDDALRLKIWKNKAKYRGKFIKFKYQKIGTKDRPRIPVFLGFRDSRDLDSTHPLI